MNQNIIKPHLFRHACKEFDPSKKIPDEEFETILEVGRLSPSSFGLEPWKMLVVQNDELRGKLKEYSWGAQKQIPTASHVVVILARKAASIRYDKDYPKHIKLDIQKYPEEQLEASLSRLETFQRDDFGMLGECEEVKLFEWSARQTYIMLANMMTAAAELGIDTCPIEGFDLTKINEILEKYFQVDLNEFGVSVMVCFGYRIKESRPKTRQKMSEIVTWFK